jgi:hypothetical protein
VFSLYFLSLCSSSAGGGEIGALRSKPENPNTNNVLDPQNAEKKQVFVTIPKTVLNWVLPWQHLGEFFFFLVSLIPFSVSESQEVGFV